jgi:hypothetical protein
VAHAYNSSYQRERRILVQVQAKQEKGSETLPRHGVHAYKSSYIEDVSRRIRIEAGMGKIYETLSERYLK